MGWKFKILFFSIYLNKNVRIPAWISMTFAQICSVCIETFLLYGLYLYLHL